jgi:muramoyltetrapeptide carboxypeptidase
VVARHREAGKRYEPRKPPRLHDGDLVAVVAPASPWERRSELIRAVAALEAWGLRVRLGEHVDDRHGYLAGRDEDRAADLHAAFADPETRAVFAFSGGYGSGRLVPLLRPEVFAADPKAFCGFSDITTLHLALERYAEVVSFYSNGASGLGDRETTDFSRESLRRALFSDEPYGRIAPDPDDPFVRTIAGGRATARLVGGCAGLLTGSLGTPIEVDTRGRILVLEEIVLDTEDLDWILTHLRNSGKLGGVAGIVVGDIVTRKSGYIAELSCEDVVEELLGPLGVPVLMGLPIGHGKHHHTLPLGALATLDADRGTLVVEEVVTSG